MRRTDREVVDRQEMLAILKQCDVIRLGINTPDYPYVVPMNFGVDDESEALVLWLHCASEGLKLDLIDEDPRVGFEADCSHRLIPGEEACAYSMEYESVIGRGDIRICVDNDDKRRALKAIMCHYAPRETFSFSDAALSGVCILRLDVMQITGKRLNLFMAKPIIHPC